MSRNRDAAMLMAVIGAGLLLGLAIGIRTGPQENPSETRAGDAPAAEGLTSSHLLKSHTQVSTKASETNGSAALASPIVCIDPGHPSETSSGCTGRHGTTEKQINWDVSVHLCSELQARGVKVVMTKHSMDEYVTNRERAEIANASGAALLFRLHCDSGGGNGITTYFPDRPGKTQGRTGPPEPICRESARAAQVIHPLMVSYLPLRDNGIKTDSQTAVGRKQGALTGSVFSRVPALTVEMVFLSNENDEAFISSEAGQQVMARAMAVAICHYLIPDSSKSNPASGN